MSKVDRYVYVTETATNDDGMNNKERAMFHYFNPYGLKEKKKQNDIIISEMADQNLCNTGAILAYGSFADYYSEALRKLFWEKKRVNSLKLWVILGGLNDSIRTGDKYIAEKLGMVTT